MGLGDADQLWLWCPRARGLDARFGDDYWVAVDEIAQLGNDFMDATAGFEEGGVARGMGAELGIDGQALELGLHGDEKTQESRGVGGGIVRVTAKEDVVIVETDYFGDFGGLPRGDGCNWGIRGESQGYGEDD